MYNLLLFRYIPDSQGRQNLIVVAEHDGVVKVAHGNWEPSLPDPRYQVHEALLVEFGLHPGREAVEIKQAFSHNLTPDKMAGTEAWRAVHNQLMGSFQR